MEFRWKRKALNILFGPIACIILAILVSVNYLAWTFLPVITQYFGQSYYTVEESSGERIMVAQSDYSSIVDLQADETEFAKQVQAEGSILLQNKGLPIKAGAKITLLGSSSADGEFLVGGGGSGSIDTSRAASFSNAFLDSGFELNPVMLDFYREGPGKCTRSSGTNVVGEAPQSVYTAKEIQSYQDYNDAAVVVISRIGQENRDISTETAEDPEKSMLELSQNELDLIDSALEHFPNVIVLLNTMNPVELGPLEDKNVSILWVGAGGEQGLLGIPGLLTGEFNPSGRLVDTYAYDNFSAPAMANFGNFEFSNIDEPLRKYYYNYAENIYIGYKYYETRYADKVYNTPNVGDYDYASQVQYPFGYGLSYTTFSYSDFTLTEKDDSLTAELTVTNSGAVAGKEVVEIYMQAPYTEYDRQNLIERSAIELVGFAKTPELEPGESTAVAVEIPKEYMRVYDASGYKTYIVEAGDYYFSVGYNAHDALNNILAAQGYDVSNGMTADGNAALTAVFEVAETDDTTYSFGANQEKITNEFDNAAWNYYDPTFRYLSRSDWTGTWPRPLGGEDRTLEASAQLIEDISPREPYTDPDAVMPTFGADNGLTLAAMVGVDYGDELWDKLLDQMSASEMMSLVAQGANGTILIESISKPAVVDKDGPAGISSTLIGGAGCFGYPIETLFASTWNLELQEKFGYFYGEDGITSGIPGTYAPACNLHRTPFCGRNFEYYSEDSFLSGVFAAAAVKNIQAKGMYTYTKHFALNDQELNRASAATFAPEQVIREIYLRPFEMSVREGDTHAMMLGKNRIGAVWTGVNENLITNVLRGEWGFKGHTVTDGTSAYAEDYNPKIAVPSGLDMYLTADASVFSLDGYDQDATLMSAVRESCHRILYNVANSIAMNNMTATQKIEFAMPQWGIALIAADVVVVIALAAAGYFSIRGLVRARKERGNENE